MSDKKSNGKSKKPRPQMRRGYICECQVCGNGLVRFFKYRDEVVGLCDECELVWCDVAKLFEKPRTKAIGNFPEGPDGKGTEDDWERATRREVERAELEAYVVGYSD